LLLVGLLVEVMLVEVVVLVDLELLQGLPYLME
jgi:hypothetical protein